MSIAMADYDRDGFLDLYLCTYSYFIGASEDKGGTPTPYHDAAERPARRPPAERRPRALRGRDRGGRPRANNDRFSFAAAWADYDGDGWPDLLVANDFGRKNLYHNEGMKNGKVTFKDVAAQAGVEDHGAGMSATWVDYDNDGRLDIYTGQHVVGGRTAGHRGARLHAGCAPRRSGTSTGATRAATRSSGTGATAPSRT